VFLAKALQETKLSCDVSSPGEAAARCCGGVSRSGQGPAAIPPILTKVQWVPKAGGIMSHLETSIVTFMGSCSFNVAIRQMASQVL